MQTETPPARIRNEGRTHRLRDISAAQWRTIGKRVFAGIGEHSLTIVSAGVAFYGMLAIFPALTALVAVYGLVADPADISKLLSSGVLPPGVAGLLHGGGGGLASSSSGVLGIGVVIGFLVTLWSARQGANAVITALNIAYGGLESRSILRRIALSLAVTLASILFAVVALIAVVVVPALLGRLDLGSAWSTGILVIRWIVLIVLVGCGLLLLYRFAPNRQTHVWRWIACGAALATALWLIGSALFSVYVGQFASYNKIYGTIGTVVVLLMWLFISALFVLLGAELDAAIEHETEPAKAPAHG